MNLPAVGTGLVYTGEGMTMYTTAAGAPAVVLGHEAGNLQHFAMIAAAQGGYATQQQDYVILGFVNGRLTVIGGESKAVIVYPDPRGQGPAPQAHVQQAASTGSTDKAAQREALEVSLQRVDAQLAAARNSDGGTSAAVVFLEQKDAQIRAAIAELQSASAFPGIGAALTGSLVDITA